MKVTVFGVGYVGLVQAAVLSNAGYDVVCVDIDEERINNLKNGNVTIFEPGLSNIVTQNYDAGRLHFTTSVEDGVKHGEFQFIAVGTPPDEDGSADLQYVLTVATSIARFMDLPKIIINKSTVPVGTAVKVKAQVAAVLLERNKDISFSVVSNPEFLREGVAVSDCNKPDRIIIGSDDEQAIVKMRELYAPFNHNHDRIIVMDIKSAELTKYAANSMLATKISFMNEISNIAERVGADIEAVRRGIGSDTRIGYNYIYPGCGYGGSCFPKDIQALIQTADSNNYDTVLLKAVHNVNLQQKELLFNKILNHFSGDLKGKIFALWGLSFKPDTDDMREASSRTLMEALWNAGAIVQAFDPEAMSECQKIYGIKNELKLMGTQEAALQGADALVIVTEWKQFRAPDFDLLKKSLRDAVIFDGRNLYDPQKLSQYGYTYYSIGRELIQCA